MSFYTTDNAAPLGNGHLAPVGCVQDGDLERLFTGFKRTVASRYRALSPEDLDEYCPPGQLHVSPKIDGQMWYLVLEDGDAWLVSHRGRVIGGDVPMLNEARKGPATRVEGRTIFAGELWCVRKEGRPRVGDVGVALAGGADAQVARLGFFAFEKLLGRDVGGASNPDMPEYKDRLAFMQKVFEGGKRVKVIKTELVSGTSAVRGLFEDWCEGGKGEGLVLRTADNRVHKVKPTFTLDAVVIGYTERREYAGSVRSVLLAVMREDGKFQLIGSCGNFSGDDFRVQFHKTLSPTVVDSAFRYASSSGALYRFVKPEIVVEITVTDIQVEDSAGRHITRMVLDYDAAKGWRSTRPMPGISILFPRFVRIRDDKGVNPVDIRASQVLERVQLDDLEQKAEEVSLPKSEILRRDVWVKTTKGTDAVRKLLVWKTGKDGHDPSWPAFVVHWTDYSPGRKAPLQRKVRLAPTQTIAMELADDLVTANIKRGWNPA